MVEDAHVKKQPKILLSSSPVKPLKVFDTGSDYCSSIRRFVSWLSVSEHGF